MLKIKIIGATDHGILSSSEIDSINKEGNYSLKNDKDHMYVLRGLYDDKLNHAADPIPFKIDTAFLTQRNTSYSNIVSVNLG